MDKVLVINAGSSSIKWKLFNQNDLSVIAAGLVERIFVDGVVETSFQDQKHTREISLNSHLDGSKAIVQDLEKLKIIADLKEVKYIGFRVVQGGSEFSKTTVINEKVLQKIKDLSSLAPLHNPGAAETIKAFMALMPHAQASATFDTSFHTTIPAINHVYPINYELAEKYNIKKYGFHGTSHQYIAEKLAEILKQKTVNFVNLHIGNGASLCAIRNSKSFDTSMGLTPLAGVMMGTRSGDIDPSIHGYLMKEANMSIEEVDDMILKNSGLKGISGISQDLRDVAKAAEKGNSKAVFALDLYAQKIADYLANYLNKVKTPEAIVFTAGVGENSAEMRQQIINKIHLIDLEIDAHANQKIDGDYQLISTTNSALPIYVIRTDEELMIAKEALTS